MTTTEYRVVPKPNLHQQEGVRFVSLDDALLFIEQFAGDEALCVETREVTEWEEIA